MSAPIRWGILGTGRIARLFAAALTTLPDAKLAAVGSRSLESAISFGNQFGVKKRYDSYEALLEDRSIDVVYIGTVHSLHKENALQALKAGKAVLCEKPFTINAAEAREVIRCARRNKLFLMEAMWTRFFPLMRKFREVLAEGAIGEPRMLTADFGFRAAFNEESRLFEPKHGGGALLDVGVYPVSLASMIFGRPVEISSAAHLGKTGVDEQSAMILKHSKGELAVLSCAIRTETPQEATLLGTEGRIHVHHRWWQPTVLTYGKYGSHEETVKLPLEGNGYQFEAIEVMNCLRQKKLESDLMPLDETLAIMETLDQIRAPWGLKYPMEKPAPRKARR